MKKLFNFSLLLLSLYLVLDILIVVEEGGRPIIQYIAGFATVFMLIYNFFSRQKEISISKQWKFIKLWYIIISIFVLYYLLALIKLPTEFAEADLRNVVIPVLIITTIVFIYNGTLTNHLNSKKLKILLITLLFNGIMEVVHAFTEVEFRRGLEVVNTSAGYVFVMILPMLMYIYRKERKWIFFITFVLTIMTGKRGAIVIYMFLTVYYLVNARIIFFQGSNLSWRKILIAVSFLVVTYLYAQDAYNYVANRIYIDQLRGTYGSGRNIFWLELFEIWWNGDLLVQMIGFGFLATRGMIDIIAHNDFLEFLVNFGLFGFSIYALMLFKFYYNIKFIKKYDNYLFQLLLTCFFIFIGRAIFAGTLRTDNINLSISIGYLLGVVSLLKNEK